MEPLNALQQDLEKAESGLKSVDSKIKEATGFDPGERRARIVSRVGSGAGPISIRRSLGAERRFSQSEDSPGAKRFRGSDSAEPAVSARPGRRTITLSSAGSGGAIRHDHDERVRPMQSSVNIARPERPPRSASQTDPHSMARNRRMFGMLVGTLEKFKSNESSSQAQARKQKEIDERLEETKRKDREETVKQREDLYRERREQTAAVNQLKTRIELAEMQKEWVAHKDELKKGKFILLKAHPPIFYRPAEHTSSTEKLVEETHKRLDEEAAHRHEKILNPPEDGEEKKNTASSVSSSGGNQQQQSADSSGAAMEEEGLTFDANADGITDLPGLEDASVDLIKIEDRSDNLDIDADTARPASDGAVRRVTVSTAGARKRTERTEDVEVIEIVA